MPGPGAKGKTSKAKKKSESFRNSVVHAEQYRTMYNKYKDAANTADKIKQNKIIPTKEQVGKLTKDRALQEIGNTQMLNVIQLIWDPDARNSYIMKFKAFAKSFGVTVDEDTVLSEDFDEEDMSRFSELFSGYRLGLTLAWLKDTLVEALIMSPKGPGSANVAN
ncbi:hypothetical protein C0993_002852, partial [Termitomyces sp. T159_Od127]